MQTALVQWHAPEAAAQIAENILQACWNSNFSVLQENRVGTVAHQHLSAA
jgi:hypothetical protein